MLIHAIVVYPESAPSFSYATSPKHEKNIKNLQKEIVAFLNQHPDKLYKLNTRDGVYYGFSSDGKAHALAVSQEFESNEHQERLFTLINLSETTENLQSIVQSRTKIFNIQSSLADLIKELINAKFKLMERGDLLQNLELNTEHLSRNSRRFREKATELRQSQYCPSLFFIYKAVKNLFVRNNDQELDEPKTKPTLPKSKFMSK